MVNRRLVPVPGAALLLLFPLLTATVVLAETQRRPGRILPDPDGSGAVVLRADGNLEHVDLATGQAKALRASGDGAQAADIARPGKGSVVYAIVPSPDGKSTALAAHDVSGEAGPNLDIKGRGYFLEVTEDGRFACIAGTKAGSKDAAPDRWILTVVDIATGEVAAPIAIGFVPTAMALRGRDGILARLFVAGGDRIATFSMVPPRPSWFYRSPGAHHDIALPAGSAVVCLLRDRMFAVIDPEEWGRDEGRARSNTDDTTAIVELDQPGASIAMSPDGRFAAVLAQDGLTMALIDVAAARLDHTIALDGARDLAARVMEAPQDDAGEPRLLLASRESRGAPPSWVDVPVPAQPEPGAIAAVASTPPAPHPPEAAQPPQPEDAGRDMTGTPPQAFPKAAEIESLLPLTPEKAAEAAPLPSQPGKPADAEPAPSPVKPQAEPAASTPAEKPAEAAPPPSQPGKPADAEPAQEKAAEPEPAAPQNPAQAHALSGRVSGSIPPELQILLYGPDNILRLGGRAPVAPDGQWRLPLPAPGRYRVVVSGGSERHVFASPEFRTIVITGSGEGMGELDFEIRSSQ